MFGFGTGIAALTAARSAIQTIGHNLANASTPGYSRQRVLLESIGGGLVSGRSIGAGVRVAELDRVTDDLLAGRVRRQQHEVSRREVTFGSLREIEEIFGEPGENGLSFLFTEFFNGLSGLGASPDDPAVRGALVQSGSALGERFQRISSELRSTAGSVAQEIDAASDQINSLADSIAVVNRQLGQAQGRGRPPAELLDRQAQLVDRLAEIVDIQTRDLGAGRIAVSVGGQMIVSGNQTMTVEPKKDSNGDVGLVLEGGAVPLDVTGGRLRGLLDLQESGVGAKIEGLDLAARALIRDLNRVHSTGVPPGGGYRSLRAEHAITDRDHDGDFREEKLDLAGLPFPIEAGQLLVSVVDEATGAVTQSRIAIDPRSLTAGGFADALSALPGLSASIDASGRLSISASIGKRFHFAPTLDENPDPTGVFGSDHAQVAGTLSEPFSLASGNAISIAVDGGAPQTITFTSGQFTNIAQATADEVAAAINTNLTGAMARVVDGRVVIQSTTNGSSSSILVADSSGSPASTLGLSTTLETGSDQAVSVTVGGVHDGSTDDVFTVRALGEGTIGVTPGLQVEVRNSAGQVVGVLDVGQGYEPDSTIEVAGGVTLAFGAGSISAAAGDRFDLNLVADSDSADVLVAFGLNAFFTGTGASDIAVSDRLLGDSSLLAQGLGSAASDNGNVQRLLALREGSSDLLGSKSLEGYYNAFVAEFGAEVSRAELALETEGLLLESYETRLEQVRGVSLDEELAELQRFELSYTAAARYISAVNEVSRVLFEL